MAKRWPVIGLILILLFGLWTWNRLVQRHVSPFAPEALNAATFGQKLAHAVSLSALAPPDLSRIHGHSSLVLDRQGRLLRAFPTANDTWRLPTRAKDVDPLYLRMLKASEDQRFDQHLGLDPLAIARAIGQALAHGHIISGASTLSMQTARLLEPKSRTFGAKIEEAARAVQLSLLLGRGGVLDIYLSLAPFGGTLEGVTAASLAWFGHTPDRLTPAEAALLVALPQSPERLRPDRHPEAAKAARNRILQRMEAHDILLPDVAHAAQMEDVPRFQRALPRLAPHLAEGLVAAAQDGAQGKILHTHIDANLQRALEVLGQSWRGKLEPGSDLAVVILDGNRLIAHLGSADWPTRQLDLSRAVRSPGSTLKPFIYAIAFDDLALHPATLMDDMPQRFGDWQPRNFDHEFHGTVTAREALQRSLNIPAVQALERVGPARFAALLNRCGARLEFPTADDPGLPLALGGVGIRLTDLAMLYAALGQGGLCRPLDILQNPAVNTPPAQRLVDSTAAQVVLDILENSPMPEGVASIRGTQRPRRIAFKTGTSYGYRDAWTVGVSAQYTVAVWVGRADGGASPGSVGRLTAAPLMFKAFDLLPPDHRARPAARDPQHPLLQGTAPPALARLNGGKAEQASIPRLRILFPPDGASIESINEGVALNASGGLAPLRWIANGVPLPENTRFWHPEGAGFGTLVVLDSSGRRAETRIRVLAPE
ncbi:MAG: penicillin-binding protein 1C [Gammaproteobacteria bacterium 28-57-27]|nr:MAG: penicillin-binding protein 1C [Gammaproteobacteria bacterium 28-57-27]